MVLKVFVSNASGNKEIKKKQEHVISILSSKKYEFEEIDITDPTKCKEKEWMWENGIAKGNNTKPLPPQIFQDEIYCGDYDQFAEAVECNELGDFLKTKEEQENGADE